MSRGAIYHFTPRKASDFRRLSSLQSLLEFDIAALGEKHGRIPRKEHIRPGIFETRAEKDVNFRTFQIAVDHFAFHLCHLTTITIPLSEFSLAAPYAMNVPLFLTVS